MYLPLSGLTLPGEGSTPAEFIGELRDNMLQLLNAFVGLDIPQSQPGSGVSSGLHIGNSGPQVGRKPGQPGAAAAQIAVAMALTQDAGVPAQPPRPGAQAPPGSHVPYGGDQPQAAAASRFAALPAATRHSWLVTHLAALRAGRITISEIP
jgi:hypothetical protein